PLIPVALTLAWTGVLWHGAASDGRTPGKHLTGLAVQVQSTGGTLGPGAALGRVLLRAVLVLGTLGVAALSYRWDPGGRQRTWWDRACGTMVSAHVLLDRTDEDTAARWAPVSPSA